MTTTAPAPTLFGHHELAERLGISNKLLSMWRLRGKVPTPDYLLACGPVWTEDTVRAWLTA